MNHLFSFDWNVIKIEKSLSTNKELKDMLINKRCKLGAVLWAKKQTSGKGRLERVWESPDGNLAFSLVVPSPHSPALTYQLNLVTALCLTEFIKNKFNINTQLKWPNDVLVDHKKICGILSEFIPEKSCCVIGIGVNLNSSKKDFPLSLQHQLTTLKDEMNKKLDENEFINGFLESLKNELDDYYRNGFSKKLRVRAEENLVYIGEEIVVSENEKIVFKGTLKNINDQGFLVLANESHSNFILNAGDVTPVKIKPC